MNLPSRQCRAAYRPGLETEIPLLRTRMRFLADSGLGRKWICFYGGPVIGFLRFVGMLNAAIWLGAAVFFTLGAMPALVARDVHALLGERYFPYISGGISQVMLTRYFYWHTAFALIALAHVFTEWLYLGRIVHRLWPGLLAGLLAVSLFGGLWLAPQLTHLHRTQHAINLKQVERDAAARSFRTWQGVFQALNVLMIGGVAVYFWRVTHPPDALRFVSPTKFRS